MKKILFLIPALCLLAACAGPKVVRETVDTDQITCEVTVYAPDVVRVVKYPAGGAGASGKESYSVVLEPQATRVQRSETAEAVVLKTEKMAVSIDKATGDVTFCDAVTGKVLLQETGTTFEARPADDPDAGRYRVAQAWKPEAEEFLYGLGQRQDPDLSLRGKSIHLWNHNMFIYIPFFCSEKGYGVYWDNPGMSDFLDKPGEETVFSSEVADCTDLYFLYDGGSMDGLMAAERKLGGKATMFPLWVHGYWQCRERYHSTEELCEALRTHREMGIPLDCIVQDWQYWGPNENWNSMRFDNPLYERADTMIANVHASNAHLAISIWPDFGPDTPQYKELEAIGALLPFKTWPLTGGVKVYDPFNEQAREIYWKYLQGLVEQGVDALWSDSTEPDHFDETEADWDYRTADGTWRSVKNAFPIITNEGIYNNYRAQGYAKRAVQMTRSAAFGIQRYATFSWSGDVQSRWEVLRAQIPSGLDYTICGIPYWNTDIGGFFNGQYGDPRNPALQELQVRWMQWSVFVPVMRNHTSGPLTTEIYRFGDPGEWPFDEQLRAIQLRYKLMPYIYSLAGATVQEDGMIMRPLVMDFAKDRKALALSDEYLFGPSLLVHPVTEPVLTDGKSALTGQTSAGFATYLPAGTDWYDFHTGERLAGGQEFTRTYGISEIPVFVRAGAILPYGPDVQYTSEKPWNNLELAVFPGADGHFTLYEDAGDGYGYEQGEFATIDLVWDDAASTLTIAPCKGTFPGMLSERDFTVTAPGRTPITVHYTGKQLIVNVL
ncbi:MAG: DUF5110 domain-containing protein [Bacteroidales bacterium]|nr:DUF5110 domain-containing protein [Bacteroidales bacterium]